VRTLRAAGENTINQEKPPISPTKKETLLEVSCKSLKSFVDKPIMLKKLPKLQPVLSEAEGFNRVFIVRA